MSRAGAAKGAKDKTKPAPPPTPVAATEIVPGKFTENDWNAMLEKDNGEDYIHDIVDEILGRTMDSIYHIYIEKQLLPFTILQAKDAILHIIEWQFLARDDGEGEKIDSGWVLDEEPTAAVTDCWAQGSVPKTDGSVARTVREIAGEEILEMEEECKKSDMVLVLPEPELEDIVSEGEAPQETDLKAVEALAAEAEAKRKEEEKKKRRKLKLRHQDKLKPGASSIMRESLDQTEMKMHMAEKSVSLSHQNFSKVFNMPASCHSILKAQNGRPPGGRDVQYDELGNVMAVMRLDCDKLPNYKVPVKFHLVDPAVDASQARLDATRRGRQATTAQKQNSKMLKSKLSVSDSTVAGKNLKNRKPIITPHPPTLLETIDVATGVAVTEFGRTKNGPGRYVRKTDTLDQHQKSRHPVTIKIRSNTISVSDLLDRDTPVLRPIDDTRPLPPIVPTPPTSGHVPTT